MSELRWDPLLEEWVATATHRMSRPQLPQNWCPFCPGSGLVPEDYDVYIYPNDFPAFSIPPPEPDITGTEFSKVKKSIGKCDVVLYTPDHNSSLAQISIEHTVKLIKLWKSRYRELGSKEEIKYVFIFENKGEVIGVTMFHPHGQIYSYPFVPPKIETEIASAQRYESEKNRCIFCDLLEEEQKDRRRIIGENPSFTAVLPFHARYPYEVHIISKKHGLLSLSDFGGEEIFDFAHILKFLLLKYDNLWGFSMPYMMVFHQAPTDGRDYNGYHFHVEFYPPHRSKAKIKYLASSESGAGVFINPSNPERKARELKSTEPLNLEEV